MRKETHPTAFFFVESTSMLFGCYRRVEYQNQTNDSKYLDAYVVLQPNCCTRSAKNIPRFI